MTLLDTSDINLIKWPGQSPGANSIEHSWDEIEQRIRKWDHHQNLRIGCISSEKITNTVFQKLIISSSTG